MLTVKPIEEEDVASLDDTASTEERLEMIHASMRKQCKGKYFENFKVIADGEIVGFMILFAHTEHIISCGPEIKPLHRRKGYAYAAEKMVLEIAKSKGYTIAVGDVLADNTASRALHEKLGFELERIYTKADGRQRCLYIKAL